MKMSKKMFNELEKRIQAILKKYPGIIEEYEIGQFPRSDKVKDLQTRFCFDLFFCTGIGVRDYYKAGLNDDHIATALRRACPKVEKKY